MARFLSPQWLDDLESALASARPGPGASPAVGAEPSGSLSVRHVVTGGPEGEASFVVRIGADGAVVDRDPGALCDIEIRQDLVTATDVATGKLSPSAAFAAGRMKLSGRVGLLVDHQEMVAAIGDPFTRLRQSTSY